MAIKTVLLDCDGVILDTVSRSFIVFPALAKRLGLRIPNKKEIIANMGKDWKSCVKAFWPDVNLEKFAHELEKSDFLETPIPAVKGAIDALNDLKNKNYYLGLITNRDEVSLQNRFKQIGICLEFFDFIKTFGDKPFKKPDTLASDEIIHTLTKKKIKESETIYVGDTLIDFETIRDTEIEFVAVLTGHQPKKVFISAGVKKKNILKSIKYLPRFLKKSQQAGH